MLTYFYCEINKNQAFALNYPAFSSAASFFFKRELRIINAISSTTKVIIHEIGYDRYRQSSVWYCAEPKTVRTHKILNPHTPATVIIMGISDAPIPRSIPVITSSIPHR